MLGTVRKERSDSKLSERLERFTWRATVGMNRQIVNFDP